MVFPLTQAQELIMQDLNVTAESQNPFHYISNTHRMVVEAGSGSMAGRAVIRGEEEFAPAKWRTCWGPLIAEEYLNQDLVVSRLYASTRRRLLCCAARIERRNADELDTFDGYSAD